ncbi:MAG: hypothetical protein WAN10_12740 [Candidatus Acidiferrales bacterium]
MTHRFPGLPLHELSGDFILGTQERLGFGWLAAEREADDLFELD